MQLQLQINMKINQTNDPIHFTLIEMILVVVVLTIIVSLMLPVLAKGKSLAHHASCSNNLRYLGLALNTYQVDCGYYPILPNKALVEFLNENDYFDIQADSYACPRDNSTAKDTYSFGYLASHPDAMDPNDPLDVCGWHDHVGSLAVFGDSSVSSLATRRGSVPIPISCMQNGSPSGPGLTVHTSDPTTISAATGQQAILTGNNVAMVSASYDPVGQNGTGEFIIAVEYDPTAMTSQIVGDSDNVIELMVRLEYCYVVVRSDPAATATTVKWTPGGVNSNQVRVQRALSIRLVHLERGQVVEVNTPSTNNFFDVDATGITGP